MAVEAGSRLGRLRIDEALGEGRLGPAYRASHPDHGPVVVKLLPGLRPADARERFSALADRLTEIVHPHLARLLEHGVHEGTPYLVVEAAGRIPLDLRFPAEPPAVAAVLPVLAAVAAALDHLHDLDLVHGSLACHQVLLDGQDRPVVTDFGLWPLYATVDGDDDAVAYTAPELLAGGTPTAASDRYAFAVLAYRLLTGSLPFPGDPRRIATAQLDGAPPAARPGLELGERVDAVLARGLERDPKARWQSCAAMVGALRAAVTRDAPPLVITPPGEEAAGTAAWRRRALVFGAGAVGVAVAFALGWTVWNGPGTVTVGLSSPTVAPGGTVVVSAANLPSGQAGEVILHSQPVTIGTFRANDRGQVRVRVTIPAWTPPGQHDLALCWRSTCPGDARLDVLAPPAPSVPPPASGGPGTSSPPAAPAVRAAPAPAPGSRRAAAPARTAGHGATSAPPPPPAPAPAPPAPVPTSSPAPTPPPTPAPTPAPTSASPSPSIPAPTLPPPTSPATTAPTSPSTSAPSASPTA